MADHEELIAELPVVEKMTTQERLKHARKRRMQQLKQYSIKEKEFTSKRRKTSSAQNLFHNRKLSTSTSTSSSSNNKNGGDPRGKSYKVHFEPSVMLLEAAARNDVEEVQRLLLLGVNPDSTNEDGLTALHQCCIDDSEKMMRLLLEFGANVNAEDSEKWTPLHAAATCGHLNLAKILINKGANLLAVNADGNMPYDICEDEKTLDYIEAEMAKRGITQQLIDDTRATTEVQMLKELREFFDKDGSDMDKQDGYGATYLHIACANGYANVVEFLLDNGANTNISDNDGWKPIHAAACWGHPDILEMLAQYGADLNAQTKNGETPYDICEDPEMKERIQELKTEMEFKQKAQQTSRLRRSQSQNTRSQSVRRTSIRDKSQISWKEAREEAKMRMENQDKFLTVGTEKMMDHSDEEHHALEQPNVVNVEDITLIVANGKHNGDEGQKTKEDVNHFSDNNRVANDTPANSTLLVENNNSNKDSGGGGDYRNGWSKPDNEMVIPSVAITKETDSYMNLVNATAVNVATFNTGGNGANYGGGNGNYGSGANENFNDSGGNGNNVRCATAIATAQNDLKLDLTVHVTVNAGPNTTTTTQYNNSGTGTLSDLKKQRTEKRSSSIVTMMPPNPEQLKRIEHHAMNGLKDRNNKLADYQCPPSPRQSKQFYGNTSEVVGASQKHGCCIVM